MIRSFTEALTGSIFDGEDLTSGVCVDNPCLAVGSTVDLKR